MIKKYQFVEKVGAVFILAALLSGCSAPIKSEKESIREREDLKKELSETKGQSSKLQSELSTLKRIESKKEKQLSEQGTAGDTKN